MRILVTTLFLYLFFSASGQAPPPGSVLFNGVYETKRTFDVGDHKEGHNYLRFYNDGQVISAATNCEGKVAEMKDWFHRTAGEVSKGRCHVDGTKISFYITGPTGVIRYKGKVTDDQIELTWKSGSDGQRGHDVYKFIDVTGMR
jgi:hypothetical protein